MPSGYLLAFKYTNKVIKNNIKNEIKITLPVCSSGTEVLRINIALLGHFMEAPSDLYAKHRILLVVKLVPSGRYSSPHRQRNAPLLQDLRLL